MSVIVRSFLLALVYLQHPVSVGGVDRIPLAVCDSSSPCCTCIHNVKTVLSGQRNGLPLNCYEAHKMGNTVSGIYEIDLRGYSKFSVI
eukprot:m.80162 g.80162  ORF g.80162 m.80162 type:complete len:88 (+) comp36180_c0_seq2:775-1038(+)